METYGLPDVLGLDGLTNAANCQHLAGPGGSDLMNVAHS